MNSRRLLWMAPVRQRCSVPHRSRLQSCVPPVRAAGWTAGPDGVREPRPHHSSGIDVPMRRQPSLGCVGSTDCAITRHCSLASSSTGLWATKHLTPDASRRGNRLLAGCCRGEGGLAVRARHFRRCHLRRRQIDLLYHVLRGCRNGRREAEHSDCSDPDGRAYHRLALPRCSDEKGPNALSSTAIGVPTSTSRLPQPGEPRITISGARRVNARCAGFDRALCPLHPGLARKTMG
jgi:hypothetical protein